MDDKVIIILHGLRRCVRTALHGGATEASADGRY